MQDKHRSIALFFLVVIFGYFSFRILQPFFSFLLLGLILAFLTYPVFRWLAQRTGQTWAAVITITAMLLLLIIPSIWLSLSLVRQAGSAAQMLQSQGLSTTSVADSVTEWTGIDAHAAFAGALQQGQTWLAGAIPRILSSIGSILIGLVIAVFVIYYAFTQGGGWFDAAVKNIPLRREYKKQLRIEIEQSTKALFYGQALTAIIIGALCGVVLALFGVSNPVFWGFLMMIFAFLPILGAPFVYVPAGIILILNGHWVAGLSIIILCTLIVFIVDNIVRPKIVSRGATIHPLIVIIGALGGVALMGFVGFITGPLILNIFVTLLKFEYEL